MADKINLVRNDTRPAMTVTLSDATTGAVIDVTGATVRLKFREVGATELTATLVAALVSPTEGVVLFDWADAPAALSGEPGNYEGEIEITFDDGTIHTVYDTLRFRMRADF